MSTILRKKQYSIKKNENNRSKVKPGDVVYLRIYGDCYQGRFIVGGEWKALPQSKQKWQNTVVGVFPMKDIVLWSRTLPQSLIMSALSNQNLLSRRY